MAYGDLGDVVDTLIYQTARSIPNEFVHVLGDIFAVQFRQGSAYNYVRTFAIDGNGQISDAYIDSILHNMNVSDDRNCLAKLTNSMCAIATCDPGYNLRLDTIEIHPDGQITDTVLDTHIFPVPSRYPGKLRLCGPGVLAVAIDNFDGTEGYLWTIKVYGDGTIEETLIDTLQFETTICREPWLEEIHPGIWAVAYRGPDYDGFIKTFSISAGGLIGPAAIDTLEFDTEDVSQVSIAKAHGDFVAIAYRYHTGRGELAIVEIGSGGAITDTVIDTYNFEVNSTTRPCVYSIGQGYIGVAYQQLTVAGVLKTFLVDENGSLNNTTIDTLVYDAGFSDYQHVVHVTGDVWAVTYQTTGPIGKVASFGLETPPEPAGPKDLMMGIYR